MGALKKIKPRFVKPTLDALPEKYTGCDKTIPLNASDHQESTMATVMMTQLYDAQVKIKYNRLLLMAQNDKVSNTYSLNRNITQVGRSRRNHLRINDPLVSVKHLTVSVSGNTCVVNDLDSSNGTFINGERVVGSRVLKDGDEIMIGKTIIRFAARQTGTPERPHKLHKRPAMMPLNNKRFIMCAAAALFLMISTAFIYLGTHIGSRLYAAKGAFPAKEFKNSLQPSSVKNPSASQPLAEPEKKANPSVHQAPPVQASHIDRALAEYATGRLDSARKTLEMVTKANEITSTEALQAKRILSMVGTVQELYAQALRAQEKKMFVMAISCWDRLLIADMELIGDRPSFLAAEAEQRVQTLAYENAMDAYRLNNHEKARQLCNVILKINPKNSNALELLDKIDIKV